MVLRSVGLLVTVVEQLKFLSVCMCFFHLDEVLLHVNLEIHKIMYPNNPSVSPGKS